MRFLYVSCLALLVAACAQQTEVVKLYEDPGATDARFDKLLVVGFTGDERTSRGLESMLTDELEGAGAEATSVFSVTGDTDDLTKEDIDAVAKRVSADGILITHFVSIDTKTDVEEARSEIVSVCRGGDPADYFLYDYEEIQVPETLKVAHTVVAVSNLYDVASGERLWSIQSTCFEKATINEVLEEEARVITRQLVTDKLIG